MPGFARKFWTMTSCTWPCSSPSAFSASSASIRSSRVSPIPMRIPLVNGIASSPASRIVSRRRAGSLSGEAQCGPPFAAEPLGRRLEHDPHRGGDGPEQLELGAGHHAGVQVREQPGLVEDEPRAALEVLERRLAAERAQLLARDLVAQLGLVAEREERLAAAGRRARARDREHLVLGHERALAAARRARERAVAADVAAERRQRDEDLRRVRDERPAPQRAAPPRAAPRAARRAGRRRRSSRPRAYVEIPRAAFVYAENERRAMRFLFLIHGDRDGEAALSSERARGDRPRAHGVRNDAPRAGRPRPRRGAQRRGRDRPSRRGADRDRRPLRRDEGGRRRLLRRRLLELATRRSSSPASSPPSPGVAVEVLAIAEL